MCILPNLDNERMNGSRSSEWLTMDVIMSWSTNNSAVQLIRLTSKKIPELRITDPRRGESISGLPSQKASSAENYPD